jgi:hypothetical protein
VVEGVVGELADAVLDVARHGHCRRRLVHATSRGRNVETEKVKTAGEKSGGRFAN